MENKKSIIKNYLVLVLVVCVYYFLKLSINIYSDNSELISTFSRLSSVPFLVFYGVFSYKLSKQLLIPTVPLLIAAIIFRNILSDLSVITTISISLLSSIVAMTFWSKKVPQNQTDDCLENAVSGSETTACDRKQSKKAWIVLCSDIVVYFIVVLLVNMIASYNQNTDIGGMFYIISIIPFSVLFGVLAYNTTQKILLPNLLLLAFVFLFSIGDYTFEFMFNRADSWHAPYICFMLSIISSYITMCYRRYKD